ncbi:MAG: sulfotransferase [Eubacterium sp.]|nr:sulfotransferase [Eubacterium sp.]
MKNWSVTMMHFLLGCRFDKLIKLFKDNDFKIPVNRLPQALLISTVSLVLFIPALLEEAYCSVFVYPKKTKEDPVFILGHWRSGTTYLQNLLSCDEQFAYFDPITTYTNNNALFLHKPIMAVQKDAITQSRPMDNLDYEVDSPSEECFAVANRCGDNIVHIMAFPQNAAHYIDHVVLADKPAKKRNDWCRAYHKVMRKTAYINGEKRLLVKSPDNTSHIQEILKIYPNAKFVHICRNPYRVIPSMVNMFKMGSEFLSLQDNPSHEDTVDNAVCLYKKLYTQYFNDIKLIPEGNLVEIKYEEFVKSPIEHAEMIYETLDIDGFDEALPAFREYVDSLEDYKVTKHHPEEYIENAIRNNLGFAFEKFGYEL